MSDRDAILQLLSQETELDPAAFGAEWALIDLGISSFAVMKLLVALETRFDIEFSDEQMEEIVSSPVSELPTVVERALAAKP
ncbi:MAG: acyl carrier protein [Acidimicrobiales bacterium]|jgi:acyl carrier protein